MSYKDFQRKIIPLENLSSPLALKRVIQVIKRGGVIIFPTDTLYGLGGNAFDEKVVQKIYYLKKRKTNKPFPVLIGRKKDVFELVKGISLATHKVIKNFWPGPLTIVFSAQKKFPQKILSKEKNIALRLPDNKIIRFLIKKANTPLIATSANISGESPPQSIQEVPFSLLKKVDLIIDGGRLKKSTPSTIIKINNNKIILLRKGRVKFVKLKNCLNNFYANYRVIRKKPPKE